MLSIQGLWKKLAYNLTLSVEKIVYIIMWRKRYENWCLGISKYAGLIPKEKGLLAIILVKRIIGIITANGQDIKFNMI